VDPVLIVALVLTLLAGGGAEAVRRRRRRNRQLREAVQQERPHGQTPGSGAAISLADVFWDLGASDFALEMMRHDGLLMREGTARERRTVHQRLDELIQAAGSYDRFIEDELDAIQEFYEAHRSAGPRRSLPTLESRSRRLLPGQTQSWGPRTTDITTDSNTTNGRTIGRPDDLESVGPGGGFRRPGGTGVGEVDLDSIESFSVTDIVDGLVEGRLGSKLETWWNERRLRSLKSQLDDAFGSLYDRYVSMVERTPDYYEQLESPARRWEREAERIDELRELGVLEDEPESMCADVLLNLAVRRACRNADTLRTNVRQIVETIHEHARRDDFAMAGYLLYLNRHAFFAGRDVDYVQDVRRIENRAHKVREEVRQVRQ
jgi:hypothetical protein